MGGLYAIAIDLMKSIIRQLSISGSEADFSWTLEKILNRLFSMFVFAKSALHSSVDFSV
jgi:hypothetical protein